MQTLLTALNHADFQWTTHIGSIWRDLPSDIPGLQPVSRDALRERICMLTSADSGESALVVALLGQGGSGKTHLLSAIRRISVELDSFFVLVDMTDVRDFWETVLLGYIRSLDQVLGGKLQSSRLLEKLAAKVQEPPSVEERAKARPPKLINRCNDLIRGLASLHRSEMREHQDVLRALVLLASNDFDIQDRGQQWLQGLGIGDEEAFGHGFIQTQKLPAQIVRGLPWLMSVAGQTVLALDQLDAIVTEHNLASAMDEGSEPSARQHASLAIIQSIAGGLSALRDVTRRTLTIVSSLEATWSILDRRAPVTMRDRFEPPILLRAISDARAIRGLVELRLQQAYDRAHVRPPYPSYPFQEGFFSSRIGASPREVLKACHEHRQACLLAGAIIQVGGDRPASAPPRPDPDIQSRFDELVAAVDVTAILREQDEEKLDKLIEAGCEALIAENPVPDHIDALLDRDFAGTSFEPLPARLRTVDRSASDRELNYALRFLEKEHHIAFQSRLKAAMTSAGIDQDLGFRRLAILRTRPCPGGALSERLQAELKQRGGLMLCPTEYELRVLAALRDLLASESESAQVKNWLAHERPVSKLALFRDAVEFLFSATPPAAAERARGKTEPGTTTTPPSSRGIDSVRSPAGNPDAQSPAKKIPESMPTNELTLGQKIIAGEKVGTYGLPVDNLTKHAVVLAGAGSGKTVLVRRVIEEAVLAGIPSIVVDGANDLTRLGDAWPARPESFTNEDQQKSARYHQVADVVIWSPGKESGNPLRLEPLPDFNSVIHDPDELQAAIDMARSSLEPIAIGGKPDKVKQGLLASTLRFFAQQGGGKLERLVAMLTELPDEANSGFDRAEKIARDMADRLRAEAETNPLFRGSGAHLDPSVLLTSSKPGHVRVSVINLSGLPDQNAQQQFINQLAMTLFSWIKKHPAKDRALQALLVIDEARDFVPSGKSVPGKDNIIRLVAQARKYGLGIVFATQAPKSIDHNVVANCSTQFFGRQNSPAAIETVKEQLTQRGASGNDVAKLPKGVFYVFTEGLSSAIKVATPLCLSHHPPSPPSEEEVLAMARQTRELA